MATKAYKKHDCQNSIKVLIQAVCILETTGPASIVTLGLLDQILYNYSLLLRSIRVFMDH